MGAQMKVGIAIVDWKLPIFERRLKAAGYAYEKNFGPSPGTLLLSVIVPGEVIAGAVDESGQKSAAALHEVCAAANNEAAGAKGRQ